MPYRHALCWVTFLGPAPKQKSNFIREDRDPWTRYENLAPQEQPCMVGVQDRVLESLFCFAHCWSECGWVQVLSPQHSVYFCPDGRGLLGALRAHMAHLAWGRREFTLKNADPTDLSNQRGTVSFMSLRRTQPARGEWSLGGAESRKKGESSSTLTDEDSMALTHTRAHTLIPTHVTGTKEEIFLSTSPRLDKKCTRI